jgi:hypothetical protein
MSEHLTFTEAISRMGIYQSVVCPEITFNTLDEVNARFREIVVRDGVEVDGCSNPFVPLAALAGSWYPVEFADAHLPTKKKEVDHES